MTKLKKYQAVLFDGDGVLWKMNQPLPGLNEMFHFLEDHNLKWALLTNNNGYTIDTYIQKLAGFNISTNSKNIFSSSTAAAAYLLDQFGKGARLHMIGMQGLRDTLEQAGFMITQGEEEAREGTVAVVAGMDPKINYKKITRAVRLILEGVNFIATNTDGTFPTPAGPYPGTGMIVGALHYSSGVEPYVAGKPHPAIFQSALKSLEVEAENVLMVGDRLETDIKGANTLGIDSAAVLTGITSREEISKSTIQPDFIFDDLLELLSCLKKVI